MNNYLIRLKPIENYFFGGESTFRNNEEDTANYFSRSNKYPQQTTLLGMLRYMLLKSNEALPLHLNKEKAKGLIGEHSFDVNMGSQDFGAIQKVSPLFIYHNNDIYRFSLAYENFNVVFAHDGNVYLNGGKGFVPIVEGYDAKQHYEPVVKNNRGHEIKFKDVFQEHNPKIGIDKQREEGDDKKFFKQVCFSLKPGFEFAFYADINKTHKQNNENKNVCLENGIVNIGGEQKQFKLSIKNNGEQKELFSSFNSTSGANRIILISDAYVSSKILDNCKFVMNEIQEFRTVKIAFGKTQFDKKTFVSTKLNLLKRGSVLYVDDANKGKVISALDENANFRNIGFNHYIIK